MIVGKLKYIFPFLLLLAFLGANDYLCLAQQKKVKADVGIQTDQSNIKVEKIPHQKLEDFKNSNDFNYLFKRAKGFDFWSLFWRWVNKMLQKFFSDRGAAPYIRYAIMFLVIAFVIYKIVGGNLSGIFSRNKKVKGQNGFDYFEEDIHQENIDQKLRDAINKRNYRTAIRFYYLSLLKQLDANELICWELGKTNRDYQRELKNQGFLDDFIRLSGIYEYSWYGHFEVNEEKFLRWQQGFRDVFQKVEKL